MGDKFTLEFSLSDFDNMNHTSMASFHIEQEHRFETCSDKPLPTSEDGMIMYWMGQNDLTAIVGEKILTAAGYEVHKLWDFVENPESEWCLLTDYKSSFWEQADG